MSTRPGANLKDERIRALAAKGLPVAGIARKMGMDTEAGRARVREGLERLDQAAKIADPEKDSSRTAGSR